MPTGIYISKTIQRRIIRAYNAGHLLQDIANKYRLSKEGVNQLLRRNGIAGDRNPGTGKHLGVTLPKKVIIEYISGASLRQLGRDYGTTYETIRTFLVGHGVKCRRRGRPLK